MNLTEKPPVVPFLPFNRLLERLRRERKVTIGVGDYVGLGRLLENWDGGSSEDIRTALASLLARNKKDYQRIEETFDEIYACPQELGNKEDPPPAKDPRRKRNRRIFCFLVTTFSAICLSIFLISQNLDLGQDDATPVPAPVPSLSRPGDPNELPPPHPQLPTPKVVYFWEATIASAVVPAFLVFLVFYRGRIRKRQVQLDRQFWRGKLQEQPGPHDYELYLSGLATPFSRDLLDDLSTILARGAGGVTSRRVDIRGTVRQTVRSGLMPTLIYKGRRIAPPLLVLQDISIEMHSWTRKTHALVEGLVRRGVRIEHWYFDGEGERVARSKKGPFRKLDEIYVRYMDSALLVISTGSAVADWNDQIRPWVRLLGRWHLCTWVNPITNRSRWKRTLKRVPMRIWPMDADGLLGAAYDVCAFEGDQLNAPRLTQPSTRTVTSEDIRNMQRLVALVPYADVNLAEYFRQKYYPDIPEDVILSLIGLGTDPTGRVLRWPREELALLLDEARQDPTREEAVRKLLIDLYEASEPDKGTVAHLRWRLDCAMQRVYLKDEKNQEINCGIRELEDLLTSPLREEVAEAVDRLEIPKKGKGQLDKLSILEPVDPSNHTRLDQLIKDTQSGPRINENLVQSSFPFPGMLEIATSLAIAGGIIGGAWQFDLVGKEILTHIPDAYELIWQGKEVLEQGANPVHGTLEMQKLSDRNKVPLRVKLYMDETPIDKTYDLSTSKIKELFQKDRGHWYRLRGQLLNGRLAVSKPLWVSGEFIPVLGNLTVIFKSGLRGTSFQDIPFSLFNGRETVKGKSDQKLELPAGNWTLAVNPRGLGRITKEVNVPPKGELDLEIEVGDYGMINIEQIPDGVVLEQVLIGGFPAPSSNFRSAPGDLTVELTNVFYDHKETVKVKAGETTDLKIVATTKFGGAVFQVTPTTGHSITVVPTSSRLELNGSIQSVSGDKFIGPAGSYTATITAGEAQESILFRITPGEYSKVLVSLYSERPRIRFEGIFFGQGKFTLNPESLAYLDTVIMPEIQGRSADTQIEIAGYTNSVGSYNYNMVLSERRAQSVHDYFVSKGAKESNLSTRSIGPDDPIASNDTPEGRASNSRVELHIFDLPPTFVDQKKSKVFRKKEIETSIRLEGIFFAYDRTSLNAESQGYLDIVIIPELHSRSADTQVEIAGYTDSRGSYDYNMILSGRRAESVRDYLVSKGINDANISAKGFGPDDPVATNDTDMGRAKNRRVELHIFK